MSTDEQDLALGKLVRERGELRVHRTLVYEQISATEKALRGIWGASSAIWNDPAQVDLMLHSIDQIESGGGLQRLKGLVIEFRELGVRESQVAGSLKSLGVDR